MQIADTHLKEVNLIYNTVGYKNFIYYMSDENWSSLNHLNIVRIYLLN